MHLTFQTGVHDPIHWVFVRGLLSWGTREPGGRGGVGVWPEGSGPDAWLYLTLSSPHGHARLRTPLQAVAEWLKRDIPPGALGGESYEVSLDAELSRLLHGVA
ncbi:SsgA family sporulation/cell division regulator [Streptomyces sp. NBC_00566]|uniref:SsgA family sporulation/cell division regulator n=1 Tax=Streptomyces sp. NBC_00566 TaxID=2975778 RepID=UPI003FCD8728